MSAGACLFAHLYMHKNVCVCVRSVSASNTCRTEQYVGKHIMRWPRESGTGSQCCAEFNPNQITNHPQPANPRTHAHPATPLQFAITSHALRPARQRTLSEIPLTSLSLLMDCSFFFCCLCNFACFVVVCVWLSGYNTHSDVCHQNNAQEWSYVMVVIYNWRKHTHTRTLSYSATDYC